MLHVGSNDLCDLTGGDEPLLVGYKLADLVDLPVGKVHRFKFYYSSNQGSHEDDDDIVVSVVNNFLQGLFRNSRAVKFWRHRRLETSEISQFIQEDGVHLTKHYHVKWVRGITGGLLPCLKECF